MNTVMSTVVSQNLFYCLWHHSFVLVSMHIFMKTVFQIPAAKWFNFDKTRQLSTEVKFAPVYYIILDWIGLDWIGLDWIELSIAFTTFCVTTASKRFDRCYIQKF